MKLKRLAMMTLLVAGVAGCTAYAQSGGYGGQPNYQPDPYNQPDPYGRPNDYDRRDDNYRHDDYDDYGPTEDVGFFYNELSPYGDWVLTREHGWAWFPSNVPAYWRPYSEGRWVNSDYGWTWASYEPFGWATYHYGRWAWDPRFGWLWVPGTIWGPAWVSWQHGGGYVGWAPLPPSVGFQVGIGIRLGGLNLSIGIRPDSYSFVPERSFLESRLSGYLVPTARNVTIIHNTTDITNYTYVDNRVFNRGVDVARIEQVTGRHLRRLRVAEARSKTRSEVADNEVRIYRPGKQNLDSVRIGPRANAGLSAELPRPNRDRNQPSVERRDAPEFEVAPRTERAPRIDPQQLERQERRARQELDRYQADEQRRLEKLQHEELRRTRAQAERGMVEKQHQAEREALRQEQRNAARQLEAREQARREAALAKPRGKGRERVVDPRPENDKGKGHGHPKGDDGDGRRH